MALNYGNIGAMDTRITIQERTVTGDSVTNEDVETWEDFATCWAELKPISRSVGDTVNPGQGQSIELFEADQQVAKDMLRLKIRFIAGLDETMRIVIDGTYHYIKGIEEWGRKSYIVLLTESRRTEDDA